MDTEKALQRKEQQTGLIAILTNNETTSEYERKLTVKSIVENSVPISELKRYVEPRQIAIALDIQLTRLVGNLNLKWNLNDSQIKTTVQDLLEKFPNESLEDFVLCFKKARQGEYGELIRLDSPIIFSWMEKYLDEKYQAVEDKLMREREDHYKKVRPENQERDWLTEWQQSVKNGGDGMKAVPQLTDEEIKAEGQEKPKRKVYEISESEMEVKSREVHEKIFQCQYLTVKERHPEWTEEQVLQRCEELKREVLEKEKNYKHLPETQKIWEPKKSFK